ncbi:disease resistance protein RUN1-like [Syzygium oleosum]|uniref:disease resistance protein RUN1-like n=1 Tax=Syzygium oleosum TaxID=219896 RepID=UPI0011D19748|nr:disease resistance protein RUN1-like [Syzygium oleosum]
MDVCTNHSSLPPTRWPNVSRYQVFLSFRGGDVRSNFLGCFHQSLIDSGIDAFIDREGIEIGEEIMEKIFRVIRQSEICIPIFSKDFASSKSCLKEVEKMVECCGTIMPIFYDVTPSVVGKQQESYQQSFCNHAAQGVESATINKWKEALQCVSGKRGWELEKFQHGDHELIKEVVLTVRRLLRNDELDVTEHLVGMDHHVQEVMRKLGVHYENGRVVEGQMLTGKCVVEISGLSGIGKSTLAKIVYNKIHHLFEGCCSFLSDVHGKFEERRLLSLQEDLISDLQKKRCTLKSSAEGTTFIKYKFRNLRVLIVLDDVSDFEQIDSLARDPSWFGPGSRIIIISMRSNLVDRYSQVPVENYESPETARLSVLETGSQRLDTSRRSSVVKICDDIIVEKYELKQMNDGHAFQLFCKYGLRGNPLPEEFSSLAQDISLATGGLPSVIQVVGSSLYGKPIKFWEEALDRLKREPFNKEVKRILKRRYEALEDNAQQIFLDTACFFMGKDKTIPCYMWEACKYDPCRGVDELHNMSLVKTRENNELWMNNQLKVLGREIVKEENPRKPFKRSRLWNREDIERVLNERKVDAVEALSATFDNSHSFPERRFFRNFSNLRYLRMNHTIIKGNKQSAKNSREDLFLPRLKWLEWQWCHNISSLLALDLSDMVVLDLSWSTSRTWRCWRQIMKKAKNLKVLILKHCGWLAESPVSHAPTNLERLNLEYCATLPGVGRSINKLRNLVSLNIKFCSFVQELPEDIASLVALKELYIDGTSIKAIDFPEGSYGKLEILSACNCKSLSLSNSIGNLKSLSYLALDDTELSELPCSIGLLENLRTLSLRNCRSLWKLPNSIGSLGELQVMDLSDAVVDELPSSVKDLRNLKVLKMPRTFIREFPGGINNLETLEEIDFSGCKSLTGECNITGLASLRVLLLVYTDISQLIVTVRGYSNLQNLRIDDRVLILKIETTKGARHQLNGCETATQFQADGHHISMTTMSQTSKQGGGQTEARKLLVDEVWLQSSTVTGK